MNKIFKNYIGGTINYKKTMSYMRVKLELISLLIKLLNKTKNKNEKRLGMKPFFGNH